MLGSKQVAPWDMAAKIDETAGFLGAPKWGVIDWPPPFGRAAYTEEAKIRDMMVGRCLLEVDHPE